MTALISLNADVFCSFLSVVAVQDATLLPLKRWDMLKCFAWLYGRSNIVRDVIEAFKIFLITNGAQTVPMMIFRVS